MAGVLKVKVGGTWVPISAAQPLPRMGGKWRRATNQSLPNNTVTVITFDTEDADSHGFGTATSSALTIPAGCAGVYSIFATFYVGVGPASAEVEIVVPSGGFQGVPSARTGWASVSITVPLLVGQTVQLRAWQASGAAFASGVGALELYRVSI